MRLTAFGQQCCAFVLILLWGCESTTTPTPSCELHEDCPSDMVCVERRCVFGMPSDAALLDAPARDLQGVDTPLADHGSGADRSVQDLVLADVLHQDVARFDTALRDSASSPDSNRPDTRQPDSNRPDSNRPDTNRPDTNRPDTNRPDLTPPCEEIVVDGSEVAVAGSYPYLDFDLDSSGKAHVCLEESSLDKFHYTTNASGSWSAVQVITDSDDMGSTSLSLGVDNADHLHLAHDGAYGQVTSNAFLYSSNSGAGWQTSAVLANRDGQSFSLDTTPGGSPRVAYKNTATDGIYYAALGTGWTHTQIQAGNMGEPHLVVDNSGFSHIVYGQAGTPISIRYATNRSGAWVIEEVALASIATVKVAVAANGGIAAVFLHDDVLYLIQKTPPSVNWGAPVPIADSATYRFGVVFDSSNLASAVYIDTSTDPKTVTLAAQTAAGGLTYVPLVQDAVIGGMGPKIRAHGDRLHVLVSVGSAREIRYFSLSRATCP